MSTEAELKKQLDELTEMYNSLQIRYNKYRLQAVSRIEELQAEVEALTIKLNKNNKV